MAKVSGAGGGSYIPPSKSSDDGFDNSIKPSTDSLYKQALNHLESLDKFGLTLSEHERGDVITSLLVLSINPKTPDDIRNQIGVDLFNLSNQELKNLADSISQRFPRDIEGGDIENESHTYLGRMQYDSEKFLAELNRLRDEYIALGREIAKTTDEEQKNRLIEQLLAKGKEIETFLAEGLGSTGG